MRFQQLFGKTLRDAPADAEMVSHQLAVRAGLVRPLTAGVYSWLPLGWRVLQKIAAIMREEMDAIGGQELMLPVVHPAEVWQQSGRWERGFDGELLKFKNREGRPFALGATHEDVVAALAVREIESHRDLPKLIYQVRTKYRDTPRPRGGLVRLREFLMKDAYSLDHDFASLDAFYPHMVAAYRNIFARVGLDVIMVEADSGSMGGKDSHEYVMLHPQGEAEIALCNHCGYAANVEVAQFVIAEGIAGAAQAVQKVATPNCKTIQDVAGFLGVDTHQTLKAVFFMRDDQEFVFVILRGDLEVNEIKLANALGGGGLRAATEEEIRATGAEPGYASPVGLKVRTSAGVDGITVVVDRSVQQGVNFVTGANEVGYHLTGVNFPRDFTATLMADIAEVYDGAQCVHCEGGTLHLERCIEAGHTFKLGTYYSDTVGVTYVDENGQAQPVVMGSYGIGLDRLAALIIEAYHDDYGIIWPRGVAPFDVHIVTLSKDDHYHEEGRKLYAALRDAGLDVLLDDRSEGAGVKFADADLIGCPLRLTVSQRAADRGAVEAKWRHEPQRFDLPLAGLVDAVMALLNEG